MLVDVSDNMLTLDTSSSKLKPYQASQLHHFGFIKSPQVNLYRLSRGSVDTVLPRILRYFEEEGIPYSLSRACEEHALKLRETIDRFEGIRVSGKEYKDGNYVSSTFNEFVVFVQKSIPRKLKEHQIKAAFHLYLVENGANFSVPGSGKTAVVLSVYEKLKDEGKVNLLFVVGPSACFGPWKTEFELTLGRLPDTRILAGGEHSLRKAEYYSPASQTAELYLTTYQTLLNDREEVVAFLDRQGIKPFLVVDEAHYIKQLGGSWATAILHIAEHAKHRCVLTGTPFPRSYTDVFNLFDFLWPGNLSLDLNTKARIQIHEKNNDATRVKEMLNGTIGPLFYRVRKADLALIPPVFHPPHELAMNRLERTIYEAIETRIRNYAKDDYLKNIELVTRLRRGRIVRLRQCVSNPSLLLSAVENYGENIIQGNMDLAEVISHYRMLETPAKLEFLKVLVSRLQQQKQKVVIWAHFIGTLELIVQHLSDVGLYCKLIYGATPIEQTSVDDEETRERIRREFVDPTSGLDILVANPAACGESISLHKTCFHAIYYDLSYNCAQYLQSLDRIHRVGGSEIKEANYYFLQYENTIDQDVKDNLDRKARRMYDVVEEDYGIYSLDMFEDAAEVEAYQRLFGK